MTEPHCGGKKGFLQHRQPAEDQMDRIYRIFQDQQDFRNQVMRAAIRFFARSTFSF